MIKTSRLLLQPCMVAHLTALMAADNSFEKTFQLQVMEGYLEFPEALPSMLARLGSSDFDSKWGSYLFIHSTDQTLIGMGGFKANPDEDGMIELGYGIANDYRGHGYATEAAQGLIQFAFQHEQVRKVWAHTLAEVNASGGVLQKCGMKLIAELDEPEAGRVWRWEILR